MDTFFISHGSPRLLATDSPARRFLQSWRSGQYLRGEPKSILVISAHWETAEPTVNLIHGINTTIHDFNNFPKHFYELEYPTPGAPDLAERVKELLRVAGFNCVEEDKTRGLDQGAWVPLMLMYPEASIPVCQLSVQSHRDGAYHYNMGKALAPLRKEGVLIFGSGSATHNLSLLDRDDVATPSWAIEFDGWLTESLLNGRHEDVKNYELKAPGAKIAHLSLNTSIPCMSLSALQERRQRQCRFIIAGGLLRFLTPPTGSRPNISKTQLIIPSFVR